MVGLDSNDHAATDAAGIHRSFGRQLLLRKCSLKVAVLIVAVAVPCVYYYLSIGRFSYLPWSYSVDDVNLSEGAGKARLGVLLEAAAMEDKTVILTTLNDAWAEPNSMFDLFLESFRIGNGTRKLLRHLVVITLDDKAQSRCTEVHAFCYPLKSRGIDFSSRAKFMSTDYLHMMWHRIDLLRLILQMGYNFVFTDTDIMWLRDPFPRFYTDVDFQIACDSFNGNPTDMENRPNGGFNYVRSNNRTVEFYKFWYESRTLHPKQHDQGVLDLIKHDPFITKTGLQMKFLDTAFFGGFCEPARDLNLACTMHANCCIGLENKINDLSILLDDWRKYTSLPPNKTASASWTVPQDCRCSIERGGVPKHHDQEKKP
ncbi:hypothetical protein MLD38_031772 [Melastoma candidum]|uniref:Uncharacterized protein n=1 Tax=Melastoma candidum TaxID=119954 RepID=A0ACB9MQP6_9MYRT|nr:hypothetical protein MLD38_031772 [Melastoma candidum]